MFVDCFFIMNYHKAAACGFTLRYRVLAPIEATQGTTIK
jgi:hypothetical protein